MQFVKEVYTKTLEVKQSKFIAYLTPYSKYEELLHSLQESNPKARHFVVAYRYLNDFSQVIEHSSDDGEPKGTSGKPSLMVLQGQELINSAVIIVRYFGGTKLGTGGLVRAYSDAVNDVINEAKLIKYVKEKTIKIRLNYTDIRMIEYECEKNSLVINNKVFDDNISCNIKGEEQKIDQFFTKVSRIVELVEDG